MAKTLASIQEQIEKLQQRAEVLRRKEAAGVIEQIKPAIAHYKMTPLDLFSVEEVKSSLSSAGSSAATSSPNAPAAAGTAKPPRAQKAAKKANKKPAAKSTSSRPVKYTDGTNSWVGHGKRPKWYVAAIEAGKSPEDLLVKVE
jgi:DNA-binding protein H-NS